MITMFQEVFYQTMSLNFFSHINFIMKKIPFSSAKKSYKGYP